MNPKRGRKSEVEAGVQKGGKSHQCPVCSERFIRIDLHMKTHKADNPQSPVLSERKSNQQSVSADNMDTATPETPSKMKTRPGGRPHKCVYCNEAFVVKSVLDRHLLTHKEKPDKSSEDNKLIERQTPSKGRSATQTPPAGRRTQMKAQAGRKSAIGRSYKCPNCEKTFTMASNLVNHMMVIHSGKKPRKIKGEAGEGSLKCNQCDQVFPEQSALTTHTATHTGDKPHKCTQCSKSFSRVETLKRHMLSHPRERPHKCTQCEQAFTLESRLVRHMMFHTGRKLHKLYESPQKEDAAYKCSVGSKRFETSEQHKGEKAQKVANPPNKSTDKRLVKQPTTVIRKVTRSMEAADKMMTRPGRGPHKCLQCDKAFVVKSVLDRHIMTHDTKPHKRSLGSKRIVASASFKHPFSNKSRKAGMKSQLKSQTERKRYECTQCDRVFVMKSVLNRHVRMSHKPEKPAAKKDVGRKPTVKHQLKTKTKKVEVNTKTMNTSGRPYTCTDCNKTFVMKSVFDRHLLTHKPEKSDKQPVSTNPLARTPSFKQQLENHTEKAEKKKPKKSQTPKSPFECTTCGEVFTAGPSLTRHMVSHSGQKPYKCMMCNKAFRRVEDRKRHVMQTHTGEKPHKCTLCNKAFYLGKELNKHVLWMHEGKSRPRSTSTTPRKRPLKTTTETGEHTDSSKKSEKTPSQPGERPYKCSHCDKSFIQEVRLLTHMTTHTGKLPHKCPICSQRFIRIDKHMKAHSGETLHKCSQCDKVFIQQSSLNKHMMTHKDKPRYTCPVCSKEFCRPLNLERHMESHPEANSRKGGLKRPLQAHAEDSPKPKKAKTENQGRQEKTKKTHVKVDVKQIKKILAEKGSKKQTKKTKGKTASQPKDVPAESDSQDQSMKTCEETDGLKQIAADYAENIIQSELLKENEDENNMSNPEVEDSSLSQETNVPAEEHVMTSPQAESDGDNQLVKDQAETDSQNRPEEALVEEVVPNELVETGGEEEDCKPATNVQEEESVSEVVMTLSEGLDMTQPKADIQEDSASESLNQPGADGDSFKHPLMAQADEGSPNQPITAHAGENIVNNSEPDAEEDKLSQVMKPEDVIIMNHLEADIRKLSLNQLQKAGADDDNVTQTTEVKNEEDNLHQPSEVAHTENEGLNQPTEASEGKDSLNQPLEGSDEKNILNQPTEESVGSDSLTQSNEIKVENGNLNQPTAAKEESFNQPTGTNAENDALIQSNEASAENDNLNQSNEVKEGKNSLNQPTEANAESDNVNRPAEASEGNASVNQPIKSTAEQNIVEQVVTASNEVQPQAETGAHACWHCGTRFPDQGGLFKHITTHICFICHDIFCQLEYLHEHIKTHAETESTECMKCGENCVDKESLLEHLKTHITQAQEYNVLFVTEEDA